MSYQKYNNAQLITSEKWKLNCNSGNQRNLGECCKINGGKKEYCPL